MSKVAVAVFSNDVDYVQIHEDLLDDIKECLKKRMSSRICNKGQIKKWSQVEYLVVFAFYDSLEVDEFRSQLQNEAITIHLLDEIMPLT